MKRELFENSNGNKNFDRKIKELEVSLETEANRYNDKIDDLKA